MALTLLCRAVGHLVASGLPVSIKLDKLLVFQQAKIACYSTFWKVQICDYLTLTTIGVLFDVLVNRPSLFPHVVRLYALFLREGSHGQDFFKIRFGSRDFHVCNDLCHVFFDIGRHRKCDTFSSAFGIQGDLFRRQESDIFSRHEMPFRDAEAQVLSPKFGKVYQGTITGIGISLFVVDVCVVFFLFTIENGVLIPQYTNVSFMFGNILFLLV